MRGVVITNLVVGGHLAVAMIDKLVHVIVGVKLPYAALQVQIFVQIDCLLLADGRVKLVGFVEARAESQL